MTRHALSPVFDGAVVAVGFLLGLVALVHELIYFGDASPKYLLGVPLIMLMGWFPMLIGRTGGGIEIGLDTCVLVFLAMVTEPIQALAIWWLGTFACQLLSNKRVSTKLFNIGLGGMAGGVSLFCIDATRGSVPVRRASCSPPASAPPSTSSSTSPSPRCRSASRRG